MTFKSLGGIPDFFSTSINTGLGTLGYALAMSAKNTGKRITFRIELDLDRVFNTLRQHQDRTQH